jgi:hypothetical protein
MPLYLCDLNRNSKEKLLGTLVWVVFAFQELTFVSALRALVGSRVNSFCSQMPRVDVNRRPM